MEDRLISTQNTTRALSAVLKLARTKRQLRFHNEPASAPPLFHSGILQTDKGSLRCIVPLSGSFFLPRFTFQIYNPPLLSLTTKRESKSSAALESPDGERRTHPASVLGQQKSAEPKLLSFAGRPGSAEARFAGKASNESIIPRQVSNTRAWIPLNRLSAIDRSGGPLFCRRC